MKIALVGIFVLSVAAGHQLALRQSELAVRPSKLASPLVKGLPSEMPEPTPVLVSLPARPRISITVDRPPARKVKRTVRPHPIQTSVAGGWQIDPEQVKRLIRVSIAQQKVELYVDGLLDYRCFCSTALGGRVEPPDVHPTEIHNHVGVFNIMEKNKNKYSRQYKVAMPFALRYHGGHFIHATAEVDQLGQPASHGCVRLAPEDAEYLFDSVRVGDPVEIR